MKTIKELNDQVHNFSVRQYTIDAVQEVYRGMDKGSLRRKSYDLMTVIALIDPRLKEDIQVLTDLEKLIDKLLVESKKDNNSAEDTKWFTQVKPEGELPYQLNKE